MTAQPLVTVPHPLLSRPASACGGADGDLAADLIDTLAASPATLGLAAPQLGAGVRALCVDVSGHPLAGDQGLAANGRIVLFDPQLEHAEGACVAREGCASVPEVTAAVRRARAVVVRGLDAWGSVRVVRAHGLEARALQHGLDHLDGRLILDRVAGVRSAALRRRLTPRPTGVAGAPPPPT